MIDQKGECLMPQRWNLVIVLGIVCLSCITTKGAEPMKPLAHFRDFAQMKQVNGTPNGWTTWTPRAEIAPCFSVDATAGRNGRGALKIEGNNNPAAFGSWRHRVEEIGGGRVYRFVAYYRADGVEHERRCVSARLDWLDANGKQARPPDYALDVGKEESSRHAPHDESRWTKVEHVAAAPDNARSVVIELSFGWCATGSVWWDDVQLREEPSPPQRVVRAVTIYHRPSGTGSAAASVEQFCRLIEAAALQKPDVICLPEGITVIGTGKSYAEISEPVPGPTTQRLGALAKKLRCYIVAGIYERVGSVIYNTAVLVGRKGEVVGAYRKTHLPREEVEGGLTPGDSYPVFDTDFGKVGLMICWDVQFPEPCRALALKGAEVILLPIWGGSDVLAKARAIENHVFLLTSSYDMQTFIVDPTGKVLAEATKEKPIAVAELHLDRKIVQPWLGDMKTRTWKERRPDIPLQTPQR
jgi:predicted amidohydrolase